MTDYSTLSDFELSLKVKNENSSIAISTLIDRHSGVYHNVAGQHKGNPYINYNEVINNKSYVIWEAAMKFDPSLGSFANLVGNMARFECYAHMHDSKKHRLNQKTDLDEALGLSDEKDKARYNEIISYLEEILPKDEKTHKIIMDRFLNGGSKPTPWREVAKKNGMSHWGCILRAQDAIKKIQEKVKKEYVDNNN